MRAAAQSRVSPPQRSAGYSDPAFVRIAELAHMLAGLVFPPNRQPSAEAGMRRAMSVLHVSSPAELLRVFESPGASRDAVLAELTVGESYFFREAAQLDLLATDILPRRRAENDGRPLRVWSAGCASGEEPYTVAIMLREQGWLDAAHIVATDIARPRLAAAQRGRYTRWALRGVSDERIARWFTRSGTYYDLAPDIRAMVEFRSFNLVVDAYPTAETDGQFDMILCRNVMIYFDMPTVARIAEGLLGALAPDGWLVLGASDPPLAQLVRCESIMTPAGMAYRRAGTVTDNRLARWPTAALSSAVPLPALTPAPNSLLAWHSPAPAADTISSSGIASAATSITSISPSAAPSAPASTARIFEETPADASPDALAAAYRRADYPAAEAIVMSMLARQPDVDPFTWITYIRSVANQGRLHEAGELNARALELHPLDAELHYLHATLLMEAGWVADAAAAARRSIYLERSFAMGHLLLGEALSRSGDRAGARNAFANARQLLERADAAAAIRAADGITVSRLRQIVALRQRDMEGVIQ